VKIGLEQADGQILSRPYSLVSAPHQNYLEIMAVPVNKGFLSPQLHTLQKGDSFKLMSPATGFLVIDEVPKSPHLFMLATGTGVGPFLSIIQGDQVWSKYQQIVLVYGVRKVEDLAYTPLILEILARYPSKFKFVPIVSREGYAQGLTGRIPLLIENGAIQQFCEVEMTPDNSQLMLCGNPEMITDSLDILGKLGFSKHLRRKPGQISMERYW